MLGWKDLQWTSMQTELRPKCGTAMATLLIRFLLGRKGLQTAQRYQGSQPKIHSAAVLIEGVVPVAVVFWMSFVWILDHGK